MTQHFGSPITDTTKDAREALRLALGLGLDVPFTEYINHLPAAGLSYNPKSLFSAGQKGFFYEPSGLYQNVAGTIPATANNDPIGKLTDQSGNNNHALQSISAKRMVYKQSPPRIFMDKVDDEFIVVIPTGGWVGEMVIATDIGTACYGVSLPAGNYLLGGRYFPSSAFMGIVFRQGVFSAAEKSALESYFVSKHAVDSYINSTSLDSAWRDFKILTSFPLINTASATNLYLAWYSCTGLTSFPLINTASATNLSYAWALCTSLTSFPLNAFDFIKGGNLTSAFANTNLNQESIDGILVSLVTSGVATGTRVFGQSGGSAPSATGKAAIDTLRSRGWTVTVTGGY